MEKTLLTSDDLAKFIDKCAEILEKEKDTSLMYDLSSLFGIIGETKNDNLFFTIQPFVGMLGAEITSFHRLISVPILPEDLRTSYEDLFRKSVDIVIKSLKELKEEICLKQEPSYEKIVQILGKMGRTFSELYDKRSRVERLIRPPTTLPPE